MLRYQLDGENVTTNRARRYADAPTNNAAVVRILRYSFAIYSARVTAVRESRGLKAHATKEATAVIVRRKQTLRAILADLSEKWGEREGFNRLDELRRFILSRKWGISESEAGEIIRERNNALYFLRKAIADANADIDHLNELRKDLGAIFGYYDGLNLSYSQEARLTEWDISEATRGNLTANAQETLYFYLIQFRKRGGKTATLDDLRNGNALLSFLLDKNDLNRIVEECAERAVKTEAINQALKRADGTREQLLNKWI